MKGFNIPEGAHVVNALPPISSAGSPTSDYWSMAKHSHVDIIVTCGAHVAVPTFTVYQSEDAAATGEDAIGFKYYAELTAAGDVLDRATDVGVGGFAAGATNNIMYVISVDAAELAEGHPFMCVKVAGTGATIVSIVAVLSGSRYAHEASETVLA